MGVPLIANFFLWACLTMFEDDVGRDSQSRSISFSCQYMFNGSVSVRSKHLSETNIDKIYST